MSHAPDAGETLPTVAKCDTAGAAPASPVDGLLLVSVFVTAFDPTLDVTVDVTLFMAFDATLLLTMLPMLAVLLGVRTRSDGETGNGKRECDEQRLHGRDSVLRD